MPNRGRNLPRGNRLGRRGVSRRSLLRGVAAGAALMGAPFPIRNAFSSSGELNLLVWSDEWPLPVLQAFTAKTGIKVNLVPVLQNDEQVAKLQAAAQGKDLSVVDLCQPGGDRAPLFKEPGLLQPFDLARVPTRAILPAALAASTAQWMWDTGLHHLPHVWGAEAMAWRTDKWQRAYAELSYGDLWSDELRGKILVRPQSMLLGIGLWMDRTGVFPSNRMLDAYVDETSMKQIWNRLTKFAIDHKLWIKQVWSKAEEAKNGLAAGDCWVGQTWDGPALTLKKAGKPVAFMAPQEGAIAWCDGLSLAKAARNVDQVYALLSYLYTPEVGAEIADASGYNTAVAGAEVHLPETAKKAFLEAYPANALDNLWWRRSEPAWYTSARADFVAKFNAA